MDGGLEVRVRKKDNPPKAQLSGFTRIDQTRKDDRGE